MLDYRIQIGHRFQFGGCEICTALDRRKVVQFCVGITGFSVVPRKQTVCFTAS